MHTWFGAALGVLVLAGCASPRVVAREAMPPHDVEGTVVLTEPALAPAEEEPPMELRPRLARTVVIGQSADGELDGANLFAASAPAAGARAPAYGGPGPGPVAQQQQGPAPRRDMFAEDAARQNGQHGGHHYSTRVTGFGHGSRGFTAGHASTGGHAGASHATAGHASGGHASGGHASFSRSSAGRSSGSRGGGAASGGHASGGHASGGHSSGGHSGGGHSGGGHGR